MRQHISYGPGLVRLSRETWWGPGYCKICGTRDEDSLVPQHVRFWEEDDGWVSGVLCVWCGEEQVDRVPQPGDFAYDGHEEGGERIDILAAFMDQDGAYTTAEDLNV